MDDPVIKQFIKGNRISRYGCRVQTLFRFPMGRIKIKTIVPIGIAHWSKWPNQIFPKKSFSFGPPKVSLPEKKNTLGYRRKIFEKKIFFLEKSGLAILARAQCQKEKWSRFLFYPLGTQKASKPGNHIWESCSPF